MKKLHKEVIMLGDATHNTLGAVRSFAEAGVRVILLLIGEDDPCNVAHSRWLKHGNLIKLRNLDEAEEVLEKLPHDNRLLVCTFDAAAMWVDEREATLSAWFKTPCRGKQIGTLFSKDAQCRLARQYGLTVPESQVVERSEIEKQDWAPNQKYPLLLKPLVSTDGEKSDIHICHKPEDVTSALQADSHCTNFIVQEYIDKEYELNCSGVVTEDDIIISGGIQKIRHYPPIVGACSFGIFRPLSELNIEIGPIKKFLRASNYHGPFSVEMLHTSDGKNYFLEVNFRNDGLAYASTSARANLHGVYAGAVKYDASQVRRTYMMNYSIDYLFAQSGDVSKLQWWRDFLRTRSFININFRDLAPTLRHYSSKFKR
ncbi:MAG: hypothetical protein K2M87_02560 [Muribaculaceae bacterium]|nr:hypothetical protein [Muribaculaceae bacterium]